MVLICIVPIYLYTYLLGDTYMIMKHINIEEITTFN